MLRNINVGSRCAINFMHDFIHQSLDTPREKPIGPFGSSKVFLIQLIASKTLSKKKKKLTIFESFAEK
jgi:hypothetical protein